MTATFFFAKCLFYLAKRDGAIYVVSVANRIGILVHPSLPAREARSARRVVRGRRRRERLAEVAKGP